jgi:hypothetical protein
MFETNKTTMKIPDKLLLKWKALRTQGDGLTMAEKIENGYPEMFNRAFREGKCNDEVFKIMADFYEEKASIIKEYL